jgi:hypothetical protein
VFDVIGGWFGDRYTDVTNAFNNVVDFFRNLFTDAWNAIKEVFSKVAEFFKGIFGEITGEFKPLDLLAIGGNLMSNLISGISGGLSGLTNALGSVTSAISGALRGAADTAKNIGSSITNAVGSGMSSAVSSVTSTASSVAGAVTGAFNSVFRRNSPPKVFLEMGADIPTALGSGIESESAGLYKLAENTGDSLIDSLEKGIADDNILGGIFDALESVNITDTGESLAETLTNGFERADIFGYFENLFDKISKIEISPKVSLPEIPRFEHGGGLDSATISSLIEKVKVVIEKPDGDGEYNSRLIEKIEKLTESQNYTNELLERQLEAQESLLDAWLSGISVDLNNGRMFVVSQIRDHRAATGQNP